MTGAEWMVIVCGGVGGYVLVSFLMHKGPGDDGPPLPEGEAQADARPFATPIKSPPWHEVLGIAPDADVPTIRAAWKRLLAQYHPDKVATLGPELQELATRKSQEIGAAYRAAMQARGETP